ncbi:uncharacterized protein FFUJ_12692 [Fusarium fujikuroi IMI 58289]|uniref:Uncharacterized protein n=1 Tax=Gibberella fujikuroi (strain CBS 195.34 / IMI 58289 / NRRL A-6831) TaxID=1279085 RepID=S0ED39_GIBF5|nr:uncharacterized protein FFUJ_12692 [Fusarium fujikuroi IMI 58289]CCT72799.1 uncharacterized protein FFUJ_12692 [Fusarium fujikuroi IMI 58289]SCO25199.1 uncharacterized protein FFM5_14010 [Fusarium fujikuroi]
MNSLLVLVLCAAGLCIAFSIANSCWSHLRYDAKGKTNGCHRASRMLSMDPFTSRFFLDAFKADNEKNVPELIVKRYGKMKRVGALGKERSNAIPSLLGSGIQVLDVPRWEHQRIVLRPSFVWSQIFGLGQQEANIQHYPTEFSG